MLTKTDLRKFKLDLTCFKKFDTLKELENSTPNIVVAKARRGCIFVQNNFKRQSLKKGCSYVMSLGMYEQLKVDQTGRKIVVPDSVNFSSFFKKYKGQNLSNKTLLVWRTGGIGDLLFIQPNLMYLKRKYPTCKIWMACGPQYQSMIENWNCVDKVFDLPFNVCLLREANYHVMFEGVIERTREAETTNSYLLFSRWMKLNLPENELVPKQEPTQKSLDYVKKVLDDNNWLDKKFIVFQSRSSSPIRNLGINTIKRITNTLTSAGYNVIFTDSPYQTEFFSTLTSTLENQNKIFSFVPHSKTISDTIALASLADGILSVDSALVHIAASLQKPVLGLYGPFPGEIRMSTYSNADWINAKADCAPCFKHGPKPCSNSVNGESQCLNNISSEEVLRRMNKLLK